MSGCRYRFEEFTLDAQEWRLLRGDSEVPLQPKVLEALEILCRSGGALLTRQAFSEALWPDTFTGDEALTQLIHKLRRALGEPPGEPRYIQTVPRRGFRFLPKVVALPPLAVAAPAPPLLVAAAPMPIAAPVPIAAAPVPIAAPPPEPVAVAPAGGPISAAPARARRALPPVLVAALLLGSALWLRAGDAPRQPLTLASAKLRRLTYFPEREEDAALSRDGERVVFASKHGGEGLFKLYVMSVLGGEPVRLTRSSAEETEPRFSPDGGMISYTRRDREGGPCIYGVAPLGGPEQLLAADGRSAAWAPDGGALLFLRTLAGGESAVLRRDLRTQDERLLLTLPGHVDCVSVSPDGGTLLLLSDGVAYQAPAAGGAARRVGDPRTTLLSLAWDASGRAFLADANLGGRRNLWRFPLAGGTPEPLTIGAGVDLYPFPAADGRRLVYTSEHTQRPLWLVGSDGRSPRPLPTKATFESVSVDPRGRRLAYSDFDGAVRGDNELGVLDLQSFQARSLGEGRSPALDASAERVAFRLGGELWVVELASGARRRLGVRVADGPPAWSPDGEHLVVSGAERPGLLRVRVRDGQQDLLAAGRFGAAAWSPDGLHVAASGRGAEGPGVYLFTIGGGARRLSPQSSFEAAPAFSADAAGRPLLRVLIDERTRPSLATLDLSGQEVAPRLLLEPPADPRLWGIFSFHPLRDGLLLPVQLVEGDIYLMDAR